MAAYRFLLVDASTGANIGDLPLTLSQPFTRTLSGVGSLSGTLPRDHPMTVLAKPGQEITVLRNNIPVWNGPITTRDSSLGGPDVLIGAHEFSWWFEHRALEIDKNYNADLFYIVRNLLNNMVVKTSNGTTGGTNINANLPRFTTLPTGGSGITKQVHYYGSARHLFADILNGLVEDPTNGLDYRMDYTTGSTRQSCQRTLTLGAPLGTQHIHRLTEHVLKEFTKNEDWARAANRVHVLGAGGYTYTLQNAGSIAAGDSLVEAVFDRSDTSNHAVIQAFAADARKLAQPPVSAYSLAFVPDDQQLPFDFCDLGDSVNIQVGAPAVLASSGYRRVVEISVSPSQGADPEIVGLTLNVPIDSLGA